MYGAPWHGNNLWTPGTNKERGRVSRSETPSGGVPPPVPFSREEERATSTGYAPASPRQERKCSNPAGYSLLAFSFHRVGVHPRCKIFFRSCKKKVAVARIYLVAVKDVQLQLRGIFPHRSLLSLVAKETALAAENSITQYSAIREKYSQLHRASTKIIDCGVVWQLYSLLSCLSLRKRETYAVGPFPFHCLCV